ncbi:RNA-directed RNA polymerase [Trichophyton equinum CBS 127.97]|uniref:RNA-dependent RNA polymerase n=1 Tax=Trichophyton equinum (strain ATCC MYA-4606 / CBS 127.97) TaxID=559882 RepID=F2PZ02_TRIEC|nr:RNA-directed RNA polymerase [Trichophyton equinum CBS 127.97]
MNKQRKKFGEGLERIIEDINIGFDLDLPRVQSQGSSESCPAEQKCVNYIAYLYWQDCLHEPLMDLFQWDRKQFPNRQISGRSFQSYFANPLSSTALRRGFDQRLRLRSEKERARVYEYWCKILHDATWIKKNSLAESNSPVRVNSSAATPTANTPDKCTPETNGSMSSKRKNKNNPEVFSTAPSSPIFDFDTCSSSDACDGGYGSDTYALSDFDKFDGFDFDFAVEALTDIDDYGIVPSAPAKVSVPFTTSPQIDALQSKINDGMIVKKSPSRAMHPGLSNSKSLSFNNSTSPGRSFSSTIVSTVPNSRVPTPLTSFASDTFRSPVYPVMRISPSLTPLDEGKLIPMLSDLVTKGPFSKRLAWFKDIPLRLRYEVERLARACDITPETILSEDVLAEDHSYDALYQILSRGPYKNKIERSKLCVWRVATESYMDPEKQTMVVFSGQLEWKDERLVLVLNPLKLEKSHRFARRYGADRFLEILLPSKHPSKSGRDAEIFGKALGKWLSNEYHYLIGRRWRAFYLEDLKSKSKANSFSGSGRKAFLFAVDGEDFLGTLPGISPMDETSENHTPMTVEQLVDWHIHYGRNTHQEYSKLFTRIRLGLSRTTATITLRPEEFIYDDDPRQEKMSDGFAMMSRSLGRAIADSICLSKVPTCFQGRIAGAKGVWVVAKDDQDIHVKGLRHFETERGYWLVINASQLKVQPPPCDTSLMFDKHQLTFDVSSYSQPPQPVHLNTQFLMVLQDRGTNKEYILSLIPKEADKFYSEFLLVQNGDSAACRAWVRQNGGDASSQIPALNESTFPPSRTVQLNMFLDAGFLPSNLAFVRRLFKENFLGDFVQKLEALKIKIPKSTYKAQIHLDLGDSWEDGTTDLDGIDVLVARAPAHLPSDIQKCRAVFHPALRYLKNVAIFPTKGEVPLASLLSGGDYDGDEVWVCWDQEIVKPFVNYPMPEIPEPEEYGLVKVSRRVGDMPFDRFMENSFIFNMSQNPLGLCTNEHERYCYHRGGIGSPLAIHFSGLLSHLADIRKSGYEYPAENRQKYRESLGPLTLRNPAYKTDKTPEQDRDSITWKSDNILDCLRFEVVEMAKERIYSRLNDDCPSINIPKVDEDLIAPWKQTWDRAIQERNSGCSKLLDAIKKLREQVEAAFETYRRVTDKLSHAAKVTFAAESLMSIQPPDIDHPVAIVWKESAFEWKNLLASCAYQCPPDSWFTWYAAFKTLCDMKARANGHWYSVKAPIYHRLTMSKSMMKKIETERRKAETEEELLLLRSLEEQEILDNDSDDDWYSVV